MLKRLFNLLWLSLVAVLLLSAVALAALRLWVPTLAEYRNEIVAAASTVLNRPLTVRRMEATWRGLSPVLKLRGVSIGPGGELQLPLEVSEIWVRIDMRHYLAERELRLSGVDVIGIDLTLVRDEQGRFSVEELPLDAQAGSEAGDLAAMSRLSIHDANITISGLPVIREPQRFRDVTLSLVNRMGRREVSGYALLPGTLGERVEIEAQLTGNSPNPLEWEGVAYFRGKGLAISTALQAQFPELSVVEASTDLRLWAQLEEGRLASLTGEVEFEDITLQYDSGDTIAHFDADRLRAQFGWRHAPWGWQLALQDLLVKRQERSWKAENLSLALATRQETSRVHANASRLDLEVLAGLLTVMPIDDSYRAQLLELQPSGVLQGLEVSLRHGPGGTRLDRFGGHFIKLGVAQTGAIPALSGLDGTISGSGSSGTLSLDSHVVELHDTRLFREALHFDRLQGDLHWRDTGTAIELASRSMSTGNQHLALEGGFFMSVPRDAAAASLDLQFAVHHAEVARVSDYLPAKIMSPTGVAWLDRSLVGGVARDGTVVIQGRLDQLPFDNGEGRLEVRLPVTGATLDFNEHWSPVTQLDAQVDFTGRQMDIRSHSGMIRSATLHDVHAQIRDLANPRLTIKGDVRGELPVMLAELGSSPLGESYGGFVDRITTSGNADLALDIVVPLGGDPAPVTVAGRIGLPGNTLAVSDTDVEFLNIAGQLDFDTEGISGDQLSATLHGRPAQVKVWTDSADGITHIDLHGRLALFDQVLATGHPLRQAISDNSDWQISVALRGKPTRGKAANVTLGVRSTLADTAIDLPAPLGKPRDTVRELSIQIDNIEKPERLLQFSYADAMHGELVIGQEQQALRLKRGVLALGVSEADLPDSDSLLITGQLETFRLADWQPLVGNGGKAQVLPLHISIAIADLQMLGHRLRDAVLDIETAGRVWTIKGQGPAAEGEIRVTQSADRIDKVVMDLEHLKLERVADADTTQGDQSMSPDDLPDLQITTQHLVYNNIDFGSIDLLAQKRPGGILEISRLALSSGILALRMTGQWRKLGETALTSVELTISDGQLEQLLDALGYQRLIKDGKLTGNLQANWPGAPWSFERGNIDGKLRVVIKDGQILDVEPGAAGRALGLLSVGMLPKRLSLDFSDLFGEGFGFNRIAGNFVLDSGNAYTNDLEVDGPAAKIDISGRVGLVTQDYDQLVTVTPYVQSGLPLAGALAGGPVVGAAVIVAGKLLEETIGLNEMARKQYTVTGSWANPVVTPLEDPATAAGQDAGTADLDE